MDRWRERERGGCKCDVTKVQVPETKRRIPFITIYRVLRLYVLAISWTASLMFSIDISAILCEGVPGLGLGGKEYTDMTGSLAG